MPLHHDINIAINGPFWVEVANQEHPFTVMLISRSISTCLIAAEVPLLQRETKDLDELGPGLFGCTRGIKWAANFWEKDIRKVTWNLEVCYKQRS